MAVIIVKEDLSNVTFFGWQHSNHNAPDLQVLPRVVLKLFVYFHISVGRNAVKNQVNHINLFLATICIRLGANIIAEGPRRDFCQKQLVLPVLREFRGVVPLQFVRQAPRRHPKAPIDRGKRRDRRPFLQQISTIILNQRAYNSPLSHRVFLINKKKP